MSRYFAVQYQKKGGTCENCFKYAFVNEVIQAPQIGKMDIMQGTPTLEDLNPRRRQLCGPCIRSISELRSMLESPYITR